MWQIIGIMVIVIILYNMYEKWKKENPRDWNYMQANRFVFNYKEAYEKIPMSKWMLMTRQEKSKVYIQRERVVSSYFDLSDDVKKILAEVHGIHPQDIKMKS